MRLVILTALLAGCPTPTPAPEPTVFDLANECIDIAWRLIGQRDECEAEKIRCLCPDRQNHEESL